MTHDKTVLRRARAGDVEAIVRLVNAGGPAGVSRPDLPGPLAASYFEAFARIQGDPAVELIVAELDGSIVGTFQLTYLTYLAGAGREDAQVEAVHVAEAHRSKGIGTLMMGWAIERANARRCRRVPLTSDKRRGDAHRFYERLGFIPSHEGMKLPLAPTPQAAPEI